MNPRTLPLLALLVIGVGYISIHRPLQTERADLMRQHTTLQEQARVDQQATLQLINDLQAQLNELEPRRASIEAALPRELNPSDTLALVRENATRNTIRVDATSIEDPQQDGDLKSIPIALTLHGTYGHLLDFITDLETHPWPLTIDTINFETHEYGGNPNLTARLTLLLHAYNPIPLDHYALGEWN